MQNADEAHAVQSKDGIFAKCSSLGKAFIDNCASLWSIVSLVIGTVIAGLSDIYKARAELAPLYLSIICAICSFLLLAKILTLPPQSIYPLKEDGKKQKSCSVLVKLFICTVLATLISSYTWYSDRNDPDGWLAAHVPAIANLQKEWGWTKEKITRIEENTRRTAEQAEKIKDNTSLTAEHTGKIAENTEQVVNELQKAVDLIKANTASDALKQLQEMRIAFTPENFMKMLLSSNFMGATLFYKAGMNPSVVQADGTNPVIAAVLKNSPNSSIILEHARENGFDPNK